MNHLPRLLAILILGVLTIGLLLRFSGLEIDQVLQLRFDLRYLLLAIAIHYSGFIVRGLRWRMLLTGLGYPLNLVYTTALLMAGWFVSALLPARLGDVARITMLHRDHQIGVSHGLASIASERALDIFAILSLTIIAGFWALPSRIPPFVWQLVFAATLFVILLLVVCILSPQLEKRFRAFMVWPLYQKIVGFGFDLLTNIRQLSRQPQLLAVVIGYSLYIWLCDILLMYFIFLSTGYAIDFSVAAFTSMVIDLAAAVPILPGAIGQFEGAALATLNLFEITMQQSGPIVLLNRFVSFWSFIIASGLVTYLFGFARVFNTNFLRQNQTLPQEN